MRPAPSASTSTCTAQSSRRPPPTATSAASMRTSPGSGPTAPAPSAAPPAWQPPPHRAPNPGEYVGVEGRVFADPDFGPLWGTQLGIRAARRLGDWRGASTE
jgi:hypothetical protein